MPFDIKVMPARHFLRIELNGDWDHAIFDRFAAAYGGAVATLEAQGGIAYCLVDASAFGLQPLDIVERFPSLIRETEPVITRRSAIVVPSLLNKVQARQTGDLLDSRYFNQIGDAMDWLFGNEA